MVAGFSIFGRKKAFTTFLWPLLQRDWSASGKKPTSFLGSSPIQTITLAEVYPFLGACYFPKLCTNVWRTSKVAVTLRGKVIVSVQPLDKKMGKKKKSTRLKTAPGDHEGGPALPEHRLPCFPGVSGEKRNREKSSMLNPGASLSSSLL